MDYKYIEALVLNCKKGDSPSKEALAQAFTPLIINLSKKYQIQGYEFSDLMSECYKTLFSCIDKYDVSKHRFVAFSTMCLKNSLKTLLRNTTKRKIFEGQEVYSLSPILQFIVFDDLNIEEFICKKDLEERVKRSFNYLTPKEKEFIHHVFIKNNSIKSFALSQNMKYSRAYSLRILILNKLKGFLW